MLMSVVSFVWSIFNTVLRGYLVKTFWLWFVVSQFPQLPVISILPAIGFSFFVSAIAPYRVPSASEVAAYKEQPAEERRTMGLFIQVGITLATLATLFSGWVVHHFM